MIIAINQPYFSPYAGYYSLIRAADIFVIFDCVQFPRRGRVHRSQIHSSPLFSDGWLTLPLSKQPQNTPICDLIMKPWEGSLVMGKHKAFFDKLKCDMDISTFQQQQLPLIDFLMEHHTTALKRLGIETKLIRSSSLNLSADLRGQDRLIAICKALGAGEYLNLPGGQAFYSVEDFAKKDIQLRFVDTSSCSPLGYLQAQAEGEFALFEQQSRSADFIA